VKPAPFRYHAPESLDEALELLAEHGEEAKVLAGGQSLVPTLNFRLARPAVLVDLNRIAALAYVEAESDGGLRVGAMTRQRAVERSPLVMERAPLVAETMPFVAHPQIRNRGTFGGSLAHADPAAELPAVALALDAELVLRVSGGERRLRARDFFVGLFATALAPGELLVEVRLPQLPTGAGCAFVEMARRHGDYALVGVAACVELGEDERVRAARVALLSVGEGPVEAHQACRTLIGERPVEEALVAAADEAATTDVDPPSDIHATSAYRRHLTRLLVRRALHTAAARARAG
jgi:carbon-monoxide dehydrogenase medium subunit